MTTLGALCERIRTTIDCVHACRIWTLLCDADTDHSLKQRLLRELFWDISCYQWFTTRAGFKMIGSLPAKKRKLMRTLLIHKWDEVEHREWAYSCYLALGGDSVMVDSRDAPMSLAASSIGAIWEWMAEHLPPISYLGAEYLFEKLTAMLTHEIAPILSEHGFSRSDIFFITEHVEEDDKHAALFDKLILAETSETPASGELILRGFDTFRAVYPLPVWDDVVKRATSAMRSDGAEM